MQINRRLSFILFLSMFYLHLVSQPPLFRNFEYLENYSQVAVDQMLEFNIPASVIMAQAILESRSGTSEMAQRSNNHFGIKCHLEWSGDTILKDDDTLSECFRKYFNVTDSYTDHSLFLASRARYANLFELSVTDYVGWCYGLKNAGYATAENYAEDLIRLIENMKLYLLDGPLLLEQKKVQTADREPKKSPFNEIKPNLYQLNSTNLLFCDEMDVHLRSLQMQVSSAEKLTISRQ